MWKVLRRCASKTSTVKGEGSRASQASRLRYPRKEFFASPRRFCIVKPIQLLDDGDARRSVALTCLEGRLCGPMSIAGWNICLQEELGG